MINFRFAAGVAILAAFALSTTAAMTGEPAPMNPVRLGTFDSRAVAVAYCRSDAFHKQLAEMKAEHQKAKDAGDTKKAERLETAGGDLQKLVHARGFGAAPIPDILKLIKPELPAIAKKSGVDVIINKWDITFQADGITTVDVTIELVELLKPNDETRKVIKELMKSKPVPTDQLSDHD